MKILFYCKDFHPIETGFSIAFGGFVKSLARARSEWSLHVATPIPLLGKSDFFISDGNVKIHRLNHFIDEEYPGYSTKSKKFNKLIRGIRFFGNRFLWAYNFKKLCIDIEPDLIFFESADEAIVLSLVAKKFKNKMVIRVHSTGDTENAFFGSGIIRKIEAYLIKNIIAKYCDVFLSTNKYHLDFIKKHYCFGNPFLIGRKYFSLIDNVVETNSKYSNFSERDFNSIVMLGRMDKDGFIQKGFLDAVFAFSRLTQADLERVKLQIIGSGPLINSILSLIDALNLNKNINVRGRMTNSEVLTLLNLSGAVLLPSRFEGQSMFALEGLSSGCIPIFSDTGGLSDLPCVEHFNFQPQNIHQLASSISKYLNTDRVVLSNIGSDAKVKCKLRFSPKVVGEIAANEMEKVLAFLRFKQ